MSPSVSVTGVAAAASRRGGGMLSMVDTPAHATVLCVVVSALLLIAGPSELPELAIGVLGALFYAVYQTRGVAPRKKNVKQVSESKFPTVAATSQRERSERGGRPVVKPRLASPRQEFRQESVVPVPKATFQCTGWEAEVQELLPRISPNDDSDRVVERLTKAVQQALHPLIPEAEVVGCASGNVKAKQAFGVAVPEVDIVVTVNPDHLISRLRSRLPNGAYLDKLDAKKLQKSAIRACADQLVSLGGFKFRRSAFRGEEPKFTLVAPTALSAGEGTTAIDFSVNSATPLQATALFRECTKLDARAADLILLMRRWARDRGISHAARGHLSPYGWTLLAVYFLQVGIDEAEGPAVLPAMEGVINSPKPSAPHSLRPGAPELTSAALFKRCLLFFAGFDWRNEAVSVRSGCRGPADLALPVHVALSDDGRETRVAPSIEDPFNGRRNIASCMSAEGVARFHEELARAMKLCSQDGSLADLLDLWAPPEMDATGITR